MKGKKINAYMGKIIKNYVKDVKDVNQTVRNVNDINIAIKDFEHSAFEIEQKNITLENEIKIKDNEINNLKEAISDKDDKISKLNVALNKAKTELSRFKEFWRTLMKRFQIKIFDEKFDNVPEEKRNYTIVAEDLEKSGIFDNNDSDIVHNPTRKILTNDELAEIHAKKGKKKSDYNLN